MKYKKIGVVVADKDEYEPFVNALDNPQYISSPFKSEVLFTLGDTKVRALLCGIGKVNAAAGAMYLIDRECDIILNFGLSGGLQSVNRGEFILPETFLEHDFDLTPLGYKPCEKPGQAYIYNSDEALVKRIVASGVAKPGGTAVCGDRFISSNADRDFLINAFSAVSCDMETAAIASVCTSLDVPFVSLRRISDDASDNARDSYNDMNKNEGMSLSDAFFQCLKVICEA